MVFAAMSYANDREARFLGGSSNSPGGAPFPLTLPLNCFLSLSLSLSFFLEKTLRHDVF